MHPRFSRLTGVVLSVLMVLAGAPAVRAESDRGSAFVPYDFEIIEAVEADPLSDASFLPSKGTVSSQRDSSTKHLMLVTVRITNNNDLGELAEGRKFEATEFTLEAVGAGVYRPHPYSRATTRVRARPGESVQMTLGFYVPAGRYKMVFRDPDYDGKIVEAEIGPPIQIDEDGPAAFLWGFGTFLAAGALVALPVVASLLRTNTLFK
ncbi:MAG: hypothetical protein VKO64_02905 [Candidatus Sericytochromatia bacterium]|nr:hypothetical protein [Candidatus Sericytochromatia bacterium]